MFQVEVQSVRIELAGHVNAKLGLRYVYCDFWIVGQKVSYDFSLCRLVSNGLGLTKKEVLDLFRHCSHVANAKKATMNLDSGCYNVNAEHSGAISVWVQRSTEKSSKYMAGKQGVFCSWKS